MHRLVSFEVEYNQFEVVNLQDIFLPKTNLRQNQTVKVQYSIVI